jgi:hypothetical protein
MTLLVKHNVANNKDKILIRDFENNQTASYCWEKPTNPPVSKKFSL